MSVSDRTRRIESRVSAAVRGPVASMPTPPYRSGRMPRGRKKDGGTYEYSFVNPS
jgi:hypothetical protein